MMKSARFALLAFLMLDALAAHAVGNRESTLDRDFQGPRVEWDSTIIGRVQDGDDTCFLLERVVDPYQGYGRADNGARFIACNPGPFDQDRFAPGQTLRVIGNLGEALPRRIGKQIWEHPVVAGAILKRIASPVYPAGGYYNDPFYDPFYSPFYGHPYGPGFSTYFFFGRGRH